MTKKPTKKDIGNVVSIHGVQINAVDPDTLSEDVLEMIATLESWIKDLRSGHIKSIGVAGINKFDSPEYGWHAPAPVADMMMLLGATQLLNVRMANEISSRAEEAPLKV